MLRTISIIGVVVSFQVVFLGIDLEEFDVSDTLLVLSIELMLLVSLYSGVLIQRFGSAQDIGVGKPSRSRSTRTQSSSSWAVGSL
jgi:hypothetical protein